MLILQALDIQSASSSWLQLVSEFEKAVSDERQHYYQQNRTFSTEWWLKDSPAGIKKLTIDRNYALTKMPAMLQN